MAGSMLNECDIVVERVDDKKSRKAFIHVGNVFAAREPNSVPQIHKEQLELITEGKNPFFGHARVQLFIAKREGKAVGRISAHIDLLALEMSKDQGFGPGVGMFGYFDAEDKEVASALFFSAEQWLREQGMNRVLGPISMSIWEEPGLLVKGQDHAPMIMMGHHPAHYKHWIEGNGYSSVKSLLTYDLDISHDFPPLIQRIVKSGERNKRINLRQVVKTNWDDEVDVILSILNDAWSNNWGFVPFTPEEIEHAGKKLRPLILEPINMIAELDGEPVAFMLTFPDINEIQKKINGKLFPFGWFHLLRWLRKPKGAGMRVPLMGVKKELHNSRLASQLAFMMINKIRQNTSNMYGSKRGEIGWILDDNEGMKAIADAIESKVNREYIIFGKNL